MDCTNKELKEVREVLHSVIERIYNSDMLYNFLTKECSEPLDREKLKRIDELTQMLYKELE